MSDMAITTQRIIETPFRLDLSEDGAAMLNRIALVSMLDHTLPDELRDFAKDLNDLLNTYTT